MLRPSKRNQHLFEVNVVGDENVGKSSFILRFTENKYTDTVICDVRIDKSIIFPLDDARAKLNIWDNYQNTHRVKFAFHGTLLLVDLTNQTSLENAALYLKDIDKTQPVLLIGTKADCMDDRQISEDDLIMFVYNNRMKCNFIKTIYEVSSKTGANINEAFITLATDMYCIRNKKEIEAYDLIVIKADNVSFPHDIQTEYDQIILRNAPDQKNQTVEELTQQINELGQIIDDLMKEPPDTAEVRRNDNAIPTLQKELNNLNKQLEEKRKSKTLSPLLKDIFPPKLESKDTGEEKQTDKEQHKRKCSIQ